jgi:hypothetical protein
VDFTLPQKGSPSKEESKQVRRGRSVGFTTPPIDNAAAGRMRPPTRAVNEIEGDGV